MAHMNDRLRRISEKAFELYAAMQGEDWARVTSKP